jgi:CRP/FNR family cyclic AMP-dependent transcriptional regulator
VRYGEVLELAATAPALTVGAGERIIAEGDPSGVLYVLVSGALEVRRGDVVVGRLEEPGTVVGELGLLLDEPASADVYAVGDVSLHRLDDAEELFTRYPAFARFVATVLARRLRQITSYLVDLQEQFADRSETLGLVHHVVSELAHDGGAVHVPGSDREPDAPY